MVDEVAAKPPGQVRGRPFPRIRALQPEEEFPLQTRCRCGGAVTYRTTTSRRIILEPASDTHGSAGAENLSHRPPGPAFGRGPSAHGLRSVGRGQTPEAPRWAYHLNASEH